jgi:hypothetical protein
MLQQTAIAILAGWESLLPGDAEAFPSWTVAGFEEAGGVEEVGEVEEAGRVAPPVVTAVTCGVDRVSPPIINVATGAGMVRAWGWLNMAEIDAWTPASYITQG